MCSASWLAIIPPGPLHGQDATGGDWQPGDPVVIPGTSDNFPFAFNGGNGRTEGFSIDVLEALARVMRLELRPNHEVNRDDLAALHDGRVTLFHSYAYTLPREDQVDFSTSYLELTGGLYLHETSADIDDLGDLSGRRVLIVGRNTVGAAFLREHAPDAEIVAGTSGEDILRRLDAGEADAALVSRLTALSVIDRLQLRHVAPASGPLPGYAVRLCFAVRNGNATLLARLNEGLSILHRTDEYEQIHQKWFGRFEPVRFTREQVIAYVAAALALALVIAVWSGVRQRQLRQRIVRQAGQLRDSESILAEAQAFAHLGHWTRTADDNKATWSDETFRIFERDPHTGPPQSVEEVIRLAAETDRGRWREALAGLYAGAEAFNHQVDVALPSGAAKRLHLRGRVTGTFGTVQDISELHAARRALQQSEQLLRALIENLPQAIGLVEESGAGWIVVSLNPGAVRLLGLRPPAAATVPLADVFPDARSFAHWQQLFQRCLDSGTQLRIDERPPGIECDLIITIVPLVRENDPRRCCLLVDDVTETRRRDIEHAQGRRLRALGELVGGIAHEFNNLLTPILFKADALSLQHGGNPALCEELAVIIDAARRSADLTRRLLAFGRKDDVRPTAFSLATVINTNVELLRHTIDRRIHLETRIPPELPTLYLRVGELQQILVNLVVNARDTLVEKLASPARAADWSPRILLEVRQESRPARLPVRAPETDTWLELIVADNGMGMPPGVVERIYEPFYTTKEAGRGTGLGLATAWHCVNEIGGRIDVTSTPGRGTRFSVYLPVLPAPPGATLATNAPRTASHAGPPRHILLLEDERSIARLLIGLLEDSGHTVEHFVDARVAWTASGSATGRFDAALLDVNTPGMTGLELAARLREAKFAGPIVMMSGSFTDENRRAMHQLRITATIPKPFTVDQVATMLESVGITLARPR